MTRGKEGYSIRVKTTLSKKYMAILNLFVSDTIALKLTSSAEKESTCNAGDPDSIPGLGKSIGKGIGYPLQYSGMENSMDCILHEVPKSCTQLSDFHFHFQRKK